MGREWEELREREKGGGMETKCLAWSRHTADRSASNAAITGTVILGEDAILTAPSTALQHVEIEWKAKVTQKKRLDVV